MLDIIFHVYNSLCSKETYKVMIVAIHNCYKLCVIVIVQQISHICNTIQNYQHDFLQLFNRCQCLKVKDFRAVRSSIDDSVIDRSSINDRTNCKRFYSYLISISQLLCFQSNQQLAITVNLCLYFEVFFFSFFFHRIFAALINISTD